MPCLSAVFLFLYFPRCSCIHHQFLSRTNNNSANLTMRWVQANNKNHSPRMNKRREEIACRSLPALPHTCWYCQHLARNHFSTKLVAREMGGSMSSSNSSGRGWKSIIKKSCNFQHNTTQRKITILKATLARARPGSEAVLVADVFSCFFIVVAVATFISASCAPDDSRCPCIAHEDKEKPSHRLNISTIC